MRAIDHNIFGKLLSIFNKKGILINHARIDSIEKIGGKFFLVGYPIILAPKLDGEFSYRNINGQYVTIYLPSRISPPLGQRTLYLLDEITYEEFRP